MPSFRSLIRPKQSDAKPKSSLSTPPKSPDLSETKRNIDALNQCRGCDNVEILIRRSSEKSKQGLKQTPSVLLHNSFEELSTCSHKCQICRVFRQALLLQQVTFDGLKELAGFPGEIRVVWEQKDVDGVPKKALKVEVKGRSGNTAVVNCGIKVGHLALLSNALNPVVIKQAKRWLDACCENHIGQCDNLKWSSENPRLLVEVLSPTSVRLCENQAGEYVALSYCWGNLQALPRAEQDEIARGKTVLANLDRRRRPFPMSDLPQTVRDALCIIHAMEIRYAWVDTLCIIQDKPEGVATMHKVYSNALFTLCACATTRGTAKLLDEREAWSLRTEDCRLGGKWLTVPDMSLTELRFKSPLAERAWTLQEERLSPRMLYVSSNRLYWSCAARTEMELEPIYGNDVKSLNRPSISAFNGNEEMPPAQAFLEDCYSGTNDLNAYWADIVKSYALRNMSHLSDRLTALSGLAAKYLSASAGDEYLAGIWSNNLAQGLAWRLHRSVEDKLSQWPSWSWAVVPLQTAIDTDVTSATSSVQRVADESRPRMSADDAIKQGQEVKEIYVIGLTRPLWRRESSRCIDWSAVTKIVDGEEKFTFAVNPEQDMHAIESERGRVLVYEGRKKAVVGQIDCRSDVERLRSGQVELQCLELGVSTMLLLEEVGGGRCRRVGVAWDVRQDFFTTAEQRSFVLI